MRAVIGRFLLLITMLLFVGCSFSPKQGSPAPVTKLESSSSTSAPINLKQILSLLETGKPDTAKAGLEAFLAQNPNHKLANKLYAQLTEDPIKHYGTRHITYQVKSGDTLGELALRYMGDAMEFYGLARYNNIKDPRKIQVGQSIKIPVSNHQAISQLQQSKKLFNESRWQEGLEQLLQITPSNQHFTQAKALFLQGLNNYYDSLTSVEQKQQAYALLQRWLKQPTAYTETIIELQNKLTADLDLAACQEHLLENRFQECFEKLIRLRPINETQREQRQKLATELSEALHRDAVVHFRSQRLEKAIQLWDQVLSLNPDHQSAKQYRKRALKLNAQLQQIN